MANTHTKERRKRQWIRWAVSGCFILCLGVLAARSSLVRPFRLGGGSAAPTHRVGDRVWVNLAAFDLRAPMAGWVIEGWGEPTRGDVVLCALPGRGGAGIKRVIAVGGETVEFRLDRLLVDGEAASYETLDPRRFAHLRVANSTGHRFLIEHLHGGSWTISCHREASTVSDFGPITVPEGHYFLVGDNRANSWDSRYPEFGCVPRSRILGRVIGNGHPIPESVPDSDMD